MVVETINFRKNETDWLVMLLLSLYILNFYVAMVISVAIFYVASIYVHSDYQYRTCTDGYCISSTL